MPQTERFLLSVDDSEPSRRALAYVGRMLAGKSDVSILLFHRLPPLPAELREHGGSEDPSTEDALEEALSGRVQAWRAEEKERMLPVLEAAREVLIEAGVSETAIRFSKTWEASTGESLAEALMRVAGRQGCHTIVIAREQLPGMQEFLHRHTSDTLVRKGAGHALWVVE